ncbi:MAG: DUF4124 domain-containing protein [Deltaproteobacteria bacterium]|nr:DUF4124 domain-containing protein [Deltaproteobacteria bacterium]
MKQSLLAIISSLALLFCSAPVTGQNIYRWTDPQGRIHFSNAPVHEANVIDDELPPATNFGGESGSIPFTVSQPRPVTQKPATPPATAKAAPSETVGEDSVPQVNSEEAQAAERAPVTGGEESPAVPFTQTAADLSESDDPDEKPKKDAPSNKKKSVPSDEDADDDEDDKGDDSGASDGSDDSHDEEDEDEPEDTEASMRPPDAGRSFSFEGKIFIFS